MNILDTLTVKQKTLLKTKTYHKDKIIIHELDHCENIGIVINGELSIVSYLENGNEIIYNKIYKDGIFGNNLIFSTSPYYKGNVKADTKVTITYINKKDLLTLLQTNKDFLIQYLLINSDFAKELNQRIKLLSLTQASDRLLYYFHINNNQIVFTNVTDLAKQLSLTRETTSRLLSKFTKEKRIKRLNNTIILL